MEMLCSLLRLLDRKKALVDQLKLMNIGHTHAPTQTYTHAHAHAHTNPHKKYFSASCMCTATLPTLFVFCLLWTFFLYSLSKASRSSGSDPFSSCLLPAAFFLPSALCPLLSACCYAYYVYKHSLWINCIWFIHYP